MVGCFLRAAAGVPYVISPRGMLQPAAMQRHRAMKSLAYWGIERGNLRSAVFLHATSALEASELTTYGPPVAQIANGVAPGEVSAAAVERLRAQARLQPGDAVVTFLGRLHRSSDSTSLPKHFRSCVRRMRTRGCDCRTDEGVIARRSNHCLRRLRRDTRWLGAVDAGDDWAL